MLRMEKSGEAWVFCELLGFRLLYEITDIFTPYASSDFLIFAAENYLIQTSSNPCHGLMNPQDTVTHAGPHFFKVS